MFSLQTVTHTEAFPKELEPYKNLIYVPLDLPEPPQVNLDRLIDFLSMRAKRDEGTYAGSVDGQTALNSPNLKFYPTYNKQKGTYPWRLVHFYRIDFPEGGADLFQELAENFPEIAEYVNSLPTKKIYTFSLLNQKPGVSVDLHTDPDLWFGIRFYLVNRSDAKLFFRKSLDPSTIRLVNVNRENNEIKQIPWENLLQDEKIYAKHPKSRFPFHLTCTHAAHGVDAVPEGDEKTRVTGFVICRVDPKEYAELLERSLSKYGEYAVWW